MALGTDAEGGELWGGVGGWQMQIAGEQVSLQALSLSLSLFYFVSLQPESLTN